MESKFGLGGNNLMICGCNNDYCYTCFPPLTPEEKAKRRRAGIKADFKYGFKHNVKAKCRFPDGTTSNLRFTSPTSAISDSGVRYSPTTIFKKNIHLNSDLNSLFKWVYGPHLKDIIMRMPDGIKLLKKANKK